MMTFSDAADIVLNSEWWDLDWFDVTEYEEAFVFTHRLESGYAGSIVVKKDSEEAFYECPEWASLYNGYGKELRFIKEHEIEALGLRAQPWDDGGGDTE